MKDSTGRGLWFGGLPVCVRRRRRFERRADGVEVEVCETALRWRCLRGRLMAARGGPLRLRFHWANGPQLQGRPPDNCCGPWTRGSRTSSAAQPFPSVRHLGTRVPRHTGSVPSQNPHQGFYTWEETETLRLDFTPELLT
ncbi:hypothetical protein AAFF_G00072040 [Aldrovandia affinis]|uniref:Uncharacterized protein n=1 Tax=Aldrovandia affinis TaxID=143900 RepID=A0AAD7RYW9_9TELE|nr:hypothetical protein AAFF_G00072040 [Aldrovandia affinis]